MRRAQLGASVLVIAFVKEPGNLPKRADFCGIEGNANHLETVISAELRAAIPPMTQTIEETGDLLLC